MCRYSIEYLQLCKYTVLSVNIINCTLVRLQITIYIFQIGD